MARQLYAYKTESSGSSDITFLRLMNSENTLTCDVLYQNEDYRVEVRNRRQSICHYISDSEQFSYPYHSP